MAADRVLHDPLPDGPRRRCRPNSIDAARVDGARGWPLLRYVVLPQLRPVHFIVAMVCAVAALRSFDYVMIMTLGGPYNSSTVLAFYMYEQTFLGQRYGYGAAIAVVLLALMSCIIVRSAVAAVPPRAQ